MDDRGGHAGAPLRWSPDGARLGFIAHEGEDGVLVSLAPTGGDGEWHVHNGGWSADGKRLVYTRGTDSGDLFVMDGVFPAIK